jgi:superfamily I DNA and/or RNA helicase
VLVGDHKQLPPYYDQSLDPYLHKANQACQAAARPLLDAQALRVSIFERLWRRFNPGQPPDSAHVDRKGPESLAEAEGMARDSYVAGGPAGPHVPGSAAFDHTERQGRGKNIGKVLPPDPVGASRCVTLDVQRRMHPDLALFVSDMFYNGQYYSPQDDDFLQSKTLELVRFGKPVTFIDIGHGKAGEEYEADLSSPEQRLEVSGNEANFPEKGFANLREARQVVEVLEAIVGDTASPREQADLQRAGEQVPLVGIIGLYAGQVALIHLLIRASGSLRGERLPGGEWLCRGMKVAVNSVDAFQGKECPVIILSFTRSNRRQAVGFVDDPHRLNVALSRARKKLILVGDAMTMTRLAREQTGGNKNISAAKQERYFFTQLVRYVEEKGKTMRIFETRKVTP